MRRSAGPPRRRYERPGPELLRVGRALGHPRPSGVPDNLPQAPAPWVSLGEAANRVIARLRPEEVIELKLGNRRYRVGGSTVAPRIERWSPRFRNWTPVTPGEQADRVLQALGTMQWHSRQ